VPFIPILPTSTLYLDQNKILIASETNSQRNLLDVLLIKLDSNLQVNFDPQSVFKYQSIPTSSFIIKNITNQISEINIKNFITELPFTLNEKNINLNAEKITFFPFYVAKCPYIRPGLPSAPQNIRAVGQDNYNQLSWDPPLSDGGSPILYYKIYRDFRRPWTFIATTTNRNFNDYDIDRRIPIKYCYRVSAVNAIGEGPMSDQACAYPPSEGRVPSAPILVVTPEYGQNLLIWSEPTDPGSTPILEYRVYQYVDNISILLATTSSSTRYYIHTKTLLMDKNIVMQFQQEIR
jgi:hypothetical protein